MSKAATALQKFKEGYNCAQSVLFSWAPELNMDQNLALRIATGFGGGMGRKQEVCGAVSGAIMALDMLYGRGEGEGKEKQEQAYAKTRELIDTFTQQYGTVNCKSLLGGCVLLSEDGQKQFREQGLIEKCRAYVEGAVKILERITKNS
jgi:C_GCAxxG_C_C family probable redox protein